jgi:hypothetical protein
MTGRDALLQAFDRLFDKAAKKLSVECSDGDKAEAKQRFEARFSMLLDALKQLDLPELPTRRRGMEDAIDKLSPADVVGLLATVPLVPQAQEMMRSSPTAPPSSASSSITRAPPATSTAAINRFRPRALARFARDAPMALGTRSKFGCLAKLHGGTSGA